VKNAAPPLLERPLNLGEIFDRALTLLTSSWRVFLAVAAIGLVPWIAYYYWYQVQYDRLPTGNVSTSGGPWYWIVYAGAGLLARLMVAASAIAAAYVYRGRHPSTGDALAGVNRHWEVVASCAAIATAVLYAEYQAAAPVIRDAALPVSTLPTAGDFVLSYLVFFVTGIIRQVVAVAANLLMCAAALEPTDLSGSLRVALRIMFASDRLPTLFGTCVALFALRWFGDQLPNVGYIVAYQLFHATSSPLVDAIGYLLINIPLAAFTSLVAISYYFDARLREGVNVPAALAEHAHTQQTGA
jgi:hypothetical protein